MRKLSATAAFCLALTVGQTFAQAPNQSAPDILDTPNPQSEASEPPGGAVGYGGEVETKLQFDGNRPANGIASGNLFNKTVGNAYFNLGYGFAVNGELTFEQLAYPTRSSVFNDQGLYISQLYGSWSNDYVGAYAGKIHPHFSMAYDVLPVFYDTLANDYEQKEMIGGGIELKAPRDWGRHSLFLEAYYLDNTFLSQSIGAKPNFFAETTFRPPAFRSWMELPSNTGTLNSFAATLTGDRIPVAEGLKYTLSASHQPFGQPGLSTQNSYSAGALYEIPVTRAITVTPFVEGAWFNNFAGTPGQNGSYFTASVEGKWRNFALAVANINQRTSGGDEPSTSVNQFMTTLSYEIMPRLTAAVGYMRTSGEGQSVNTYSTALIYAIKF